MHSATSARQTIAGYNVLSWRDDILRGSNETLRQLKILADRDEDLQLVISRF